jgi:prephenate dehydrogenase
MNPVFKATEVIGAGLIGTSIALKLVKNGGFVRLIDPNTHHQKVANQLMGAALLDGEGQPECVIVATPVDVSAMVIIEALRLYPNAIVIDIGSVKTKVLHEVWTKGEKNSDLLRRYLPTHPMAGREFSGPEGAQSDLFESRPWAITPHPENSAEIRELGARFITEMGAIPQSLTPEEHDQQVAMTSHAPQILASALAGSLSGELALSGQGLRDMTRLAHSDPDVWISILSANAAALGPHLQRIVKSINLLIDNNFDQQSVLEFMERGRSGVQRIPGKHGGIPRNYSSLNVVIPDRAGQLAALFNHCADVKINIEDLRIEHSPGQETGLITLYVQTGDLSTLEDHLSTLGWQCTEGKKII